LGTAIAALSRPDMPGDGTTPRDTRAEVKARLGPRLAAHLLFAPHAGRGSTRRAGRRERAAVARFERLSKHLGTESGSPLCVWQTPGEIEARSEARRAVSD
jgi:hypothetical protein